MDLFSLVCGHVTVVQVDSIEREREKNANLGCVYAFRDSPGGHDVVEYPFT